MISVILPVCNCEDTIERAIQSVLGQTFSDWELVLIDDGSTDRSGAICRSYAHSDSRIHCFSYSNAGVSAARNRGLQVCHGDWVTFLDSDDFLDADYLQVLFSWSKDADLVCCSMQTFPKQLLKPLCTEKLSFCSIEETEPYFSAFYYNGFYNSPCNKLYKRTSIVHGFDPDISLGEDFFFNMDYFSSCDKIVVLPQELYHYRFVHSENTLSKKLQHNPIELQYKIYERIVDTFGDSPAVRAEAENRMVGNIIDAFRRMAKSGKYSNREKEELMRRWFTPRIWQSVETAVSRNRMDKKTILWRILRTKNVRLIRLVFSI